MKEYGMVYIKKPELIFRTKKKSLDEAINYFAKLKQLPRKKFLRIFSVEEIER
jgi:hypothetical protein